MNHRDSGSRTGRRGALCGSGSSRVRLSAGQQRRQRRQQILTVVGETPSSPSPFASPGSHRHPPRARPPPCRSPNPQTPQQAGGRSPGLHVVPRPLPLRTNLERQPTRSARTAGSSLPTDAGARPVRRSRSLGTRLDRRYGGAKTLASPGRKQACARGLRRSCGSSGACARAPTPCAIATRRARGRRRRCEFASAWRLSHKRSSARLRCRILQRPSRNRPRRVRLHRSLPWSQGRRASRRCRFLQRSGFVQQPRRSSVFADTCREAGTSPCAPARRFPHTSRGARPPAVSHTTRSRW